jgi:ankyrin repeat protein
MRYANIRYPGILLLIFLINIPSPIFSQVVVLDTTMNLSHPLTSVEKADLNNYLMLAASTGTIPAIDWLLKNGAEIDCKNEEEATPLIIAIANDQTEAVKTLLKYKPDVNIKTIFSETPLLAAVKNGNLDIAEALIRDSADINLSDKNGATALHYASVNGNFYITDMLLYYEAETDLKSNDGTTPLIAAIWADNADIADLLIYNGANCEEKDNQGFTPLMVACQMGDTLIMKLLLDKKVNIYEANDYHYDALNHAIRSFRGDAINYLFYRGYKLEARLPNTVSPYYVAMRYNRPGIIKILKKNKVPDDQKFAFDRVAISTSIKFTSHDFFTGINVALSEPHLNGGIIAGIDFKPGYTRVLMKTAENTYYQYKDKSAMFYGGLFKDFYLTNNPYKVNWVFTASAVSAYGFGSKLKGTNIIPWNKIIFIPSIGIKLNGTGFSVFSNIDYMNTMFYKIGPVWLRFGMSYNIFFNYDKSPLKIIKWN